MLTAYALKDVLSYDEVSGEFVWIKRTSNRIKVGDTAGRQDANGYLVIGIFGEIHYAHRLAWLYMTGAWPDGVIDHADGNRENNSFGNLRNANQVQNGGNARRSKRNTSGYKGVSYDKARRLWRANIKVGERHKQIGRFLTAEDAHSAYCAAAKRIFGEFARAA